MVAIMAKFSYFIYFFNFSDEDVETVHEHISDYGMVDFVFEESEASMQLAETDNGFCIKVEHRDDLEYCTVWNTTFLRLYLEGGDAIAEWKIPRKFSSVTVETHC